MEAKKIKKNPVKLGKTRYSSVKPSKTQWKQKKQEKPSKTR